MSIKRINEFPEGSGSLSSDDIFLFMDDPSGESVTKKISLSELSSIIGGGSGTGSSFQIAPVDLHNGGVQTAQVLQFDDDSIQSVITGPTPPSGDSSQRIIIQGQRAQGGGEGGDVYVWGGDSDANGGDIKIYAGDADNVSPDSGYGGYVNIDGGKGATTGGDVEITAGYSAGGQAGDVDIVGGSTSSGVAGNVNIKTNNNNHWTFGTDASLTLPVNGSIICPSTPTYYVMADVDGHTVTSSDGLNWNGPYDLNTSINHVATNDTTIVAIDGGDNIGYTSFSNPSAITSIPVEVFGITNISLSQIIYGGGYFVVAGNGIDVMKSVPLYGYSSDGSNWTFKIVEGELATTLASNNDENCSFSDIDYNGTGWNFAVVANNIGGGVYTTDITETFTSSNYFGMVAGQQVAWNGSSWYIINADVGSGFNPNVDPRINEWDGPYNPWGSSQEDLGINITGNISDTFCGGNGYLAFSDGYGHISFSSDNGVNWTYKTPIPYTATITNISLVDNKYQLTLTGEYTSHANGEKITISGSSVTEYNGIYFLDDQDFLYTTFELITPWTPEPASFSGTADLTWSHGQYIDAMDYVNGYFYIGNDDEQIARSNDLINWTIVDDRNDAFDYWNDFSGYSSGGIGGLIINGNEIMFSDGSIQTTAPTVIDVVQGSGVSVTSSSGTFTVGVSGLNASYISDFNESVDDRVDDLLIAGAAISLDYVDASGTLTISAINEVALDSQEPNGFVHRLDCTISTSGNIFSIAPTGSSYQVYIQGVKFTKNSTETITIPSGVTGPNYVHFNITTGDLDNKTTPFNFSTDIPVAYVVWNSTSQSVIYLGDERHGIHMDSATHLYLHNTQGTQYISGLSISNYVLDGNGSSNSHASIAIGDGIIYDEDIVIDITNGNGGEPFHQVLSPSGSIPVYYHNGSNGSWAINTNSYPLKYSAFGAQYNKLNGTWTAADATTNSTTKYISMFICASNNIHAPVFAIMGQNVYTSQGAAENNGTWESLDLTYLPANEMKPLYRLVYATDRDWTNTPKSSLQSILDLRSQALVMGGLTQNDHGSLYGLADDDHLQYVHIDNDRTISANHTFTNGLTAGGLISAASGTFTHLAVSGVASFTQLYPTVMNLGDVSSTVSTDADTGQIFDVRLTGSVTLSNPTNPTNGITLRWRIKQDGSGGRTVTLDSAFKIPSSATSPLPFSTIPDTTDLLAATYNSATDKWDIIAFVMGY